MDIPRIFNIAESAHRIHDPFTPEKLATLFTRVSLHQGQTFTINNEAWPK